MQKINFKNLPDTSTPLNASTLNQMQDNIESAIDTVASDIPTVVDSLDGDSTTDAPSVHAVKEQIDSLNVYSENEVIVGSWFGKTLYRKVLHTTLPTTSDGVNTSKDIDISSLNKEIIKIPETLVITNQQQFLPIYYANNAGNSVKTFILGDVLRIYNAVASYSEADCYITLEYTKTTD